VSPRHPDTAEQQQAAAAEKNKAFFAENEDYARAVAELDTYRNIRTAIDAEVTGIGRLLDVGNGGAFDYSPELVGEIVAVDLFLDGVPRDAFPPNVVARAGDALALDELDGAYEAVLMAFLLHHLVGERPSDLVANARRALAEGIRVLQPGGRLIVVESCVAPWFFAVEQALFYPLKWVAQTSAMSHPATLQLPAPTLRELVEDQGAIVERDQALPVGRWLLQFGKRWPSALTPARPRLLTARKPPVTGGRA
jgi:SAM-dependent methyltransferase